MRTNGIRTTQKPVLLNETHKLIGHFEIQTSRLISIRRPDLVIINKEKGTCWNENFAVTADQSVKLKENEKKDKCQDFTLDCKMFKTSE